MIELDIGGGRTVQIQEPLRGSFENNLRGAVVFGLTHMVYDVLGWAGTALGEFAASFSVRWLERMEPALVSYVAPLIDQLLADPDLETVWRDFLTMIKEPTDQAGAALAFSLGSQAAQGVSQNLIQVLLRAPTYRLNSITENNLQTPQDALTMWRFGLLTDAQLRKIFSWHGFNEDVQANLENITRPRPSPSDLTALRRRGIIDQDEYLLWLGRYGYDLGDAERLYMLSRNVLDGPSLLHGYLLGNLTESEARDGLNKLGFDAASQDVLLANVRQLLPATELVREYHRGIKTELQVRSDLATLGLSTEDIDAYLLASHEIPGPQDLVHFAVREAYRDDVAARWSYDEEFPEQFAEDMARHGFDRDWAVRYWRSHWVLPSPTAAYEMLHRNVINQEELATLLKLADYPVFWRDKLQAISYTPLTRVDVRRMHAMGVLDDDGVRRAYKDIGYNDANAELMLQFTKEYNDSTGVTKTSEYESKMKSVLLRGYERGYYDRATTIAGLREIGLEQDEAGLLVDVEKLADDIANTPDLREERLAEVRRMVELGYSRGYVSRSTAEGMLSGAGYSDVQAQAILDTIEYWRGIEFNDEVLKAVGDLYTSRSIERGQAIGLLNEAGLTGDVQAQHLETWELQRSARVRHLTLAQYTRAVETGIIETGEFRESMRALGYTERDIAVYTQLYEIPE